jgi:Domain of unknown function (DUF4598)
MAPSARALLVDSARAARMLDAVLLTFHSLLAVLGRLSSFVPQLAAANAELASALSSRPASDFDVECIEADGEGPHIEMDLACGVLDLQDEAAQHAAQLAMAGQSLAAHMQLGSDDSSDEDGEEEGDGEHPRDDRSDKAAQPRDEAKRPRIEELAQRK